jgi:hypothetical protein
MRARLRLAVALAGLLAAPVSSGGEIIDRVVAVVAGDLILQSDVVAARDLGLVPSASASDVHQQVLARLIDRALMLAEVNRYAPPEPEAAAVDRELQTVRARFPSAEAFAATLARLGIGDEHLRGTLRDDLRIRAYLDQRFAVTPASEDALGRYYREHPEQFTFRGVLVPFERARPDVARAVAASQRRTMVNEWLAGLRRRTEVIDLSAE